MDLSSIALNQSGDEHLEAKYAIVTNTPFKLESLTTNIPNQLIIENVFKLVSKLVKKLSHHQIRDFLKSIYVLVNLNISLVIIY